MKRTRRNQPTNRSTLPARDLSAVTGGVWLDLDRTTSSTDQVQAARENLILREDEILGTVE